MLTSIVILTYNQIEYTKLCINSIRRFTKFGTYEIIAVDNASTDGTIEWLKQQDDIKTIFNLENLGFPKGCNQGIEIANGENILLLNNDTVVTQNWLDNLLTCLYSSEDIGAVGPVTNSAAYYTAIPVQYQTIDEMHEFASQYNFSASDKWEERLKLIGFCLLIKKKVVEKIGLLDEQFSPGNFEDDDYSVRLRKAGYKLFLCKDTFIHHFGSISWRENVNNYSFILSTNEKKFMDKWGTNSQSYIIHYDLIEQIDFKKNQELNILHIGCQSGGTLLELRNRYPNVALYGIESNQNEGLEAKAYAEVTIGDIEKSLNNMNDQLFDIIMVTCWEKILSREELLQTVNRKLKANGTLLTSMLNISNYKVINNILIGNNPAHSGFFSLNEIYHLLNKEGFLFKVLNIFNKPSQATEQQFIDKLCELTSSDFRNQFETFKYVISLYKMNGELIDAIENLKENKELEQSILYINKYSPEEVIEFIKSYYENPIYYLHSLAINNFQMKLHDNVIPFLQAAFDLEPDNKDTVYNLAYILNVYKQNELAKKFLEPHIQQDQKLRELYNEIVNDCMTSRRKLTFLLRRLENHIQVQESEEILLSQIKANIITENEINEVIDKDIINQIEVLNRIAVINFENNLMNMVLPFLNKAFELNPKNDNTLFNLGYVLKSFGEFKLALNYLNRIANKDDEVLALIADTNGAVVYE